LKKNNHQVLSSLIILQGVNSTMKKMIFPTLALSGLLSVAAFAQTPNPPARPATAAPTTQTATGGTGAEGKIALISTGAFRDGIQELKIRLDALNSEFDPKNKDLEARAQKVENLKKQIETQRTTVQPAVVAQWQDQLAEEEKQLKRLSEDLQAMGNRRLQEVSGPVYDKIGKFLEQYAQQRGIVLVMEGNAMQQNGMLIYYAAASNITEDFMKEYNKVNPVAGGAAPKK
jgi:outer membrane protein